MGASSSAKMARLNAMAVCVCSLFSLFSPEAIAQTGLKLKPRPAPELQAPAGRPVKLQLNVCKVHVTLRNTGPQKGYSLSGVLRLAKRGQLQSTNLTPVSTVNGVDSVDLVFDLSAANDPCPGLKRMTMEAVCSFGGSVQSSAGSASLQAAFSHDIALGSGPTYDRSFSVETQCQ